MVAVEALAYGLAIAGSRIGGLSDVTCENGEGKNAYLFDLSTGSQGLAAALKPLLTDPRLCWLPEKPPGRWPPDLIWRDPWMTTRRS